MYSNNHFTAIAELDLDPIKVKLMHVESGEGWTLEKAESIAFEYRRFLHLMKLFPTEQTAPLSDVDTFWHYHILDTQKYAADCEQVFGYFLHHFPYIGLRGEADEAAHERVGQRMRELYEQTFGADYIRAGSGTAYSGAATAYSGAQTAAKVAYSGASVAYSGASVAYSGASVAKTAYSGASVAYSGASVAYSGALAQQADEKVSFYALRPALNSAA